MTFLTTKDLQDLIKVDKSTIYRMAEDGRIPAVKVGRQWRFPADAVETWLRLGAAPVESSDRDRLVGVVSPGVAQAIIEVVAEAAGVMAVLTDMDGTPLTAVANPCGLFTSVGSDPAVRAKCTESWRRYGTVPELVPRFHPSDFGFLCARAFIRHESRLLGMVIAGGIARDDWPPDSDEIRSIAAALGVGADTLAPHIDEVYRVGPEERERILRLLPRVGVLFSNLVEERLHHTGTLAAIADLAETRS